MYSNTYNFPNPLVELEYSLERTVVTEYFE